MPQATRPKYPVRFEERVQLDQLPWFEADRDRIVLADQSVGKTIDMHTHYALPALWPNSIDLEAETDSSNLLLGCCSTHHLDIYANQNFSKRELRALKRDLIGGALLAKGKRRDHTAPNLTRDLRDVGIVHANVLAIDMALPSKHVAETIETGVKRSGITVFGSVHPRKGQRKMRLEEQMHGGIRGIKLHPSMQTFHPNDPGAREIYAFAAEHRIPILWHCGPVGIEPRKSRALSQVAGYEAPIRDFPETTFILGHAGALQSHEAVLLQRKYPNVVLEVSCISLAQMEHLIDNADPDRIVFGSDWPFYHPCLQMAKVLMLTDDNPTLRSQILYDNAARLLDL